MTIIAMSALLLGAPLSALRWGVQWELFRWIIPVFLFLVVCKIATADDRMSEIPFVQPLLTLLFCWISYSMQNNHAEEPTEYRRKRNRRIKVSTSNPVTPNPKRKARKDKKKKTRMEKEKAKDDKEKEPKTKAVQGQRPMEQLTEFKDLNMSKPDIYDGISPFVLTHRQLLENDYPLDTKERPGRVHTRSSLPKHETKRRCARCRHSFHIIDNVYHADSSCLHHFPVKPSLQTGRYTCCNGDQWSEGCMLSSYHVTAEHCLEDVPFSRVRSKRHVKAEDAHGIYGLDCEMSYTTAGLEVTKICLVGIDGITIYDTHVKPDNIILDYNTEYSGVTADDLAKVTTTLADVQAYLLKTLHKDSVLVGHALSNDLKALRIIHDRVVDTSVLFPHSLNPRLKYSLRALAKQYLDKDIQEGQHDCIEDARTCLALVLRKVATVIDEYVPDAEDENRNAFLLNGGGGGAVVPQVVRGEVVYVPYRCGLQKGQCVTYQQPVYWNIFYPR